MDDNGKQYKQICENSIYSRYYSIFNIFVLWTKKFGVRKIIVLDDITMTENHNPYRESLVSFHDGKTIDFTFVT